MTHKQALRRARLCGWRGSSRGYTVSDLLHVAWVLTVNAAHRAKYGAW